MKRAYSEDEVRAGGIAAIGAVVGALPDGETAQRLMALFCATEALGRVAGLTPYALHQIYGVFLEGEKK